MPTSGKSKLSKSFLLSCLWLSLSQVSTIKALNTTLGCLKKLNGNVWIVEDAANSTLNGNDYSNFYKLVFPAGKEIYCYHEALYDFKITLSPYSLADYYYFSIALGEMTKNSTSKTCHIDDSTSLSAFTYDYGYTTSITGDLTEPCGYYYGIDFFSSASTSTIYGELFIYTNSCTHNVIMERLASVLLLLGLIYSFV